MKLAEALIVRTDLQNKIAHIDDISKQYREIDTKMQGVNWTIDLL